MHYKYTSVTIRNDDSLNVSEGNDFEFFFRQSRSITFFVLLWIEMFIKPEPFHLRAMCKEGETLKLMHVPDC